MSAQDQMAMLAIAMLQDFPNSTSCCCCNKGGVHFSFFSPSSSLLVAIALVNTGKTPVVNTSELAQMYEHIDPYTVYSSTTIVYTYSLAQIEERAQRAGPLQTARWKGWWWVGSATTGLAGSGDGSSSSSLPPPLDDDDLTAARYT